MIVFFLIISCATPFTSEPAAAQATDTSIPIDDDGDGSAIPQDCDDSDPEVSSLESEVCGNGRDDNCDGLIDEAAAGCTWEGVLSPSSADLAIPEDGAAGSAFPAPYSVFGAFVAVRQSDREVAIYDVSARAAIEVGASETIDGLNQVDRLVPLATSGSGTTVAAVRTDADFTTEVYIGNLSPDAEFHNDATIRYSFDDLPCPYFATDVVPIAYASEFFPQTVAISCTSNGWPSNGDPPAYVFAFDPTVSSNVSIDEPVLAIHGQYWEFGVHLNHGDMTGDGLDDLIVGSPDWVADAEQYEVSEEGRIFVFDGAQTGVILESDADAIVAARRQGILGASTATVGDVTGDGYPDLAVGDGASAWILAGPLDPLEDSAEAWATWLPSSDAEGEQPGYRLAAGGDIDGDEEPDLIIGAPWNGGATYLVYAMSEGTWQLADAGARIHSTGYEVLGGHDLDGDGLSDFLLGSSDTVSVFYGRAR